MSYRACLKPRRPRLLHVIILCIVLIIYFTLLDTYTRFARSSLAPTSPPTITYSNSTLKQHQKPARILLVSAFFPLARSKHSIEDYKNWLSHFVGSEGIQCDAYIYTTPELSSLFLSLHESNPSSSSHALTINTTYSSPMAVPPLKPYEDKYNQMHAWDRERRIHNPELYAVWNAKPWLLSQAVSNLEVSGRTYDYAFWNDAGSFRSVHAFRAWPDPWRVQEVFERGKILADLHPEAGKIEVGSKDLVFFPLCDLPGWAEYAWTSRRGPVDMDFSEGSFFGSTPSGIAWFTRTFYDLHNHYISTTPPFSLKNLLPTTPPSFHFVGKDQTLINAVMFQHPSRFIGVIAPERTDLLPPMPFPMHGSTTAPSSTETVDSNSTPATTKADFPEGLIPYVFSLDNVWTRVRSWVGKFRRPPSCGGDWFYYQWWFASTDERRATERIRGWRGAGVDGGCEESKVFSIEGLLQGMFGAKWVERHRAT